MLSLSVESPRLIRWAVVLIVAVGWVRPAPGQSPAAPTQPSSHPSGEVLEELHIKDLDLAGALRMLTMQTRDNVILSSKVDGNQKVEANLYNVTFEQVLDSLLTPLGLVHQRQGNFIYVYTRKELEDLARQQRAASSTVFKLHYITAFDAAVMIRPLLSPAGQVSATAQAVSGIESGTGGTGGNSYATCDALVVTDFPENLESVAKVLKELDVRPRQVLVEATILRATLTEDNALGVDFNTLGGVDFASLTASSSTGSSTGSTAAAQYPGNALKVDGNLERTAFNKATFNVKTDFLGSGMFKPGGFSFGVVTNNVAAFIRALEEVTDTTVVANPKVLALNKQKGEVIVGRRDGYLTTIRTETEDYQKVEFLETGTRLTFRPFIADDGYVRMELHPRDSTGELTAANLPFEENTEVTTNLLVKDGHTVVIGGLFREQTKAARAQVPWLGNIPYVGLLFRRQADKTIREEAIILLTVHIIENNQAYSEASEKVLEDVERLRVGLRQHLMPQGREQLAHAHYRWALQHLEAGETAKAAWDLNMATSLQPRFVEAIAKREQLARQRVWQANSSLIRNLIYNRLVGAEDVWRDTMGAPADGLSPAPDADNNEWGTPIRTFRGPTTHPDQDKP